MVLCKQLMSVEIIIGYVVHYNQPITFLCHLISNQPITKVHVLLLLPPHALILSVHVAVRNAAKLSSLMPHYRIYIQRRCATG